MSEFSKKGLYEQLSSSAGEGFTQAEAPEFRSLWASER